MGAPFLFVGRPRRDAPTLFLLPIPRQIHLVAEEVQQQQGADAATATACIAGAARSHDVWRNAHALLADHLQHLDQGDALGAKCVNLFA